MFGFGRKKEKEIECKELTSSQLSELLNCLKTLEIDNGSQIKFYTEKAIELAEKKFVPLQQIKFKIENNQEIYNNEEKYHKVLTPYIPNKKYYVEYYVLLFC